MTLYSPEHAAVYDAFKDTSKYAKEVESLLPHFEDNEVDRVIDVGCGTGNHAAILASKAYDVLGVDVSESMLSVARQNHPNLTFRKQNAEESLPITDAITLFDSVFTYLKPSQQRQAIQSYSESLTTNGVLYLDIAFTTKTTPETGWAESETATWQDTRYEKKTSTDRMRDEVHAHITIRNKDDDSDVDDTTHVHHIVNPDQLRTMLRANRFSILDEQGHQRDPWRNWEVICARR